MQNKPGREKKDKNTKRPIQVYHSNYRNYKKNGENFKEIIQENYLELMDIHFQKECMLDQMRHIKVKIVKFQKNCDNTEGVLVAYGLGL